MLVLMIGLGKTGQNAVLDQGNVGDMRWLRQASASHARANWRRWSDSSMDPRHEQPSEQSVFDDNPFLYGFFAWMDSPEGERAQEVLDTLLDLMEDVQLDPKQRQFVSPDAEPLDLQQCWPPCAI